MFAVAAVPVALASAAYACQSTVTLYANPNTVIPGGSITVTGNKYNASLPVDIRLDSRTAPSLVRTTGAVLGSSGVSVTIPANTSLGYHILIATQYNAQGVPCTGCPGRTTIKVVSGSTSTAGAASSEVGFGGALVANPLGLPGFALASAAVAVAIRRQRRRTALAD